MLSRFKCPRTLFSYLQPLQSFFLLEWNRHKTNVSLFFLCASWPPCFSFLSNSPWKQEGREKPKRSSASPEERRGARRSRWYDGLLAHVPLWICAAASRSSSSRCFKSTRGTGRKSLLTDVSFSKMLTALEQSHCCRQQEARRWWALVHTGAFVL